MPLLSQYKLNGYLYNPALVGAEPVMSYSLIARDQWAGYDKAPRTLWANGYSRITNKRIGIGGSFYNDRDGLINNTGGQVMYAYHIPLKDAQLSLGASLSFFQYKLNKNDMLARDPMDPILYSNSKYFATDAGVGAFYKASSYYAGLSISNLFQSKMKFGKNDLTNNTLNRIYYISGGYFYKMNSDITIEPHTLIRYSQGYKTQMDFNLAVMYLLKYWGGIGFRTSKDLLFFVGGNYQNYLFGYAFDYALTDMSRRNYSTHEIFLSVRFGKSTTNRFQGSDIY